MSSNESAWLLYHPQSYSSRVFAKKFFIVFFNKISYEFFVALLLNCKPFGAQLCLHKRSSLKMPHRGIFFTVGFKSLRILGRSKLKAPMKGAFSFGLPEGIWTPILRNRNPLRYPIAPRADVCGRVFFLPFFIFNSHNLLSENQLQKLLCNSL